MPSQIEAGHRNSEVRPGQSHVGMTERADAHDPVVAEADEEIHKQVQELQSWIELPMHM